MERLHHRACDALRPVRIIRRFQKGPQGSVLIEMGRTRVICAATIEDRVPHFLRGTGTGWLKAEYALLPSATATRTPREVIRGRQSGRSQEIQRLIGRSLRAVLDLKALGERTINVDCDVIEADGGTRTASVTGAFVAVVEACASFYQNGGTFPVTDFAAAISVGIGASGEPMLDLCYEEDSHALVDLNVVMTGGYECIEVQGTGEGRAYTRAELNQMLDLATKGIDELIAKQKDALGGELVWKVGRVG